MAKKKSKPTKKDQALQEYMEYLDKQGRGIKFSKSFEAEKKEITFKEKIDNIVNTSFDNLDDLLDARILGIEKCGKGPSTGYVDGVQYKKDHQRVTDGQAKVGDLEKKQLQAQLDVSVAGDSHTMELMDRLDDYPQDAIGHGLYGENYENGNITFGDEPDEIGAWSGDEYGFSNPFEEGYSLDFDEAMEVFEGQMNNAPPLTDNMMLFTQDIPNPELEEGDVFQLDTYLGVNFKKKLTDKRESWTDVDIPSTRENRYNMSTYYSSYDSNNPPYEVTVLGSEGTPMLMMDPYRAKSTPSHTGVLNKGQSVRLVRVNHDKRTAIYQTVDG